MEDDHHDKWVSFKGVRGWKVGTLRTPRLINRRYETWFNKWQWKKRSMTKATQDIKNHASFIGRCINLYVCKFIITLNSMNLNIHHCLSYIN